MNLEITPEWKVVAFLMEDYAEEELMVNADEVEAYLTDMTQHGWQVEKIYHNYMPKSFVTQCIVYMFRNRKHYGTPPDLTTRYEGDGEP